MNTPTSPGIDILVEGASVSEDLFEGGRALLLGVGGASNPDGDAALQGDGE